MATKYERLEKVWGAIPSIELSEDSDIRDESWFKHSAGEYFTQAFYYLSKPAIDKITQKGHNSHSLQLRKYWYYKAQSYFSKSHLLGLNLLSEKNNFRIELKNNEWVNISVRDIDGPTDITECLITIDTESEKSSCSVAIERDTGKLVDILHPMTMQNEIRENGEASVIYNVTFKNGKIATIEQTKYLRVEEGLPRVKQVTKIDATDLCRINLK